MLKLAVCYSLREEVFQEMKHSGLILKACSKGHEDLKVNATGCCLGSSRGNRIDREQSVNTIVRGSLLAMSLTLQRAMPDIKYTASDNPFNASMGCMVEAMEWKGGGEVGARPQKSRGTTRPQPHNINLTSFRLPQHPHHQLPTAPWLPVVL